MFFKKIRGKVLAISSKKLTFSYGENQILKNINIDIDENKIISIIGKSGSGKSTFLKIIVGVIKKKYFGKIRILNKNRILTKDKIGFVSQDFCFIEDLSLKDNILIFGYSQGLTKEKSFESANSLFKKFELNINLSLKPNQLSGGQKMRFNVILSLLNSPKIIIMDEPFNALDFLNRKLLWHFIHNLKKEKKTIILTSHFLSEMEENCDEFIVLKKGEIFFKGTLKLLKEKIKINKILEIKFLNLTTSKIESLKKFTTYKDIKILDTYNDYFLIAFSNESQRVIFLKEIKRLNLLYREISYREPNLDEVFLGE